MEFTLFSFKTKKPKHKTVAQQNKEFWLNELQCLRTADGNEVICVRGKDIECVWTENNGQPFWKTTNGHTEANPEYKPFYLISTKAGQTFQLTRTSWLKCRYEDANYEESVK